MKTDLDRRTFLAAGASVPAALWSARKTGAPTPANALGAPPFKLGMITYNVGAAWDLTTLLGVCRSAGYGFVELRATHAHKVEPGLGADQRRDVRKQFEDSGVALWSFGTVCEFQAADPAVVQKNIEECRSYCALAADLGARGVKVRPNGLPKGGDRKSVV